MKTNLFLLCGNMQRYKTFDSIISTKSCVKPLFTRCLLKNGHIAVFLLPLLQNNVGKTVDNVMFHQTAGLLSGVRSFFLFRHQYAIMTFV